MLSFKKGVDEQKTTVLIIDEGQKIPEFCLELLREFLNYETNDYKLLQIAIFAQKEFENTLEKYANFTDRINLYHRLEPMSFKDTRDMIQFRLNQSSAVAQKLALVYLSCHVGHFQGNPRISAENRQSLPPQHAGHDYPE